MRLIDADELGKKLDELYAEVEGIDFGGVEGFHLFQDGIVDAQYAVDEMPTIDAEPVIRCKDCKHYKLADNRAFGMPIKVCKWFGFEDVDDNDYCSRAERRKK